MRTSDFVTNHNRSTGYQEPMGTQYYTVSTVQQRQRRSKMMNAGRRTDEGLMTGAVSLHSHSSSAVHFTGDIQTPQTGHTESAHTLSKSHLEPLTHTFSLHKHTSTVQLQRTAKLSFLINLKGLSHHCTENALTTNDG